MDITRGELREAILFGFGAWCEKGDMHAARLADEIEATVWELLTGYKTPSQGAAQEHFIG